MNNAMPQDNPQNSQQILDEIRSFYGLKSKKDEFTLFSERQSNIEFFGNGAFGLVFKVQDQINQVFRVVKKMDVNSILHQHTLKQWLNIIESVRNANSPYVATIADRMQFVDGYLFLIMRKENHGDLEGFMEEHGSTCLSERAAKWAVEGIIMALSDLYDLGMFHRDVKLMNFVVAGQQNFKGKTDARKDHRGCLDVQVQLKLIDFDFVDYIQNKDHRNIGAAFYMAPQVARNEDYKNPDVFSLGMLWQRVLTGHYMIEDSIQQNKAIKDPILFEKLKKEAFEAPQWQRLERQHQIKTDKQLIQQMTSFEEKGRPQPEDLLGNNQFNVKSHVLEDHLNDNQVHVGSKHISSIHLSDVNNREDLPMMGRMGGNFGGARGGGLGGMGRQQGIVGNNNIERAPPQQFTPPQQFAPFPQFPPGFQGLPFMHPFMLQQGPQVK